MINLTPIISPSNNSVVKAKPLHPGILLFQNGMFLSFLVSFVLIFSLTANGQEQAENKKEFFKEYKVENITKLSSTESNSYEKTKKAKKTKKLILLSSLIICT